MGHSHLGPGVGKERVGKESTLQGDAHGLLTAPGLASSDEAGFVSYCYRYLRDCSFRCRREDLQVGTWDAASDFLA